MNGAPSFITFQFWIFQSPNAAAVLAGHSGLIAMNTALANNNLGLGQIPVYSSFSSLSHPPKWLEAIACGDLVISANYTVMTDKITHLTGQGHDY